MEMEKEIQQRLLDILIMLSELKSAERTPRDRHIAILVTDLEKLMNNYEMWIIRRAE